MIETIKRKKERERGEEKRAQTGRLRWELGAAAEDAAGAAQAAPCPLLAAAAAGPGPDPDPTLPGGAALAAPLPWAPGGKALGDPSAARTPSRCPAPVGNGSSHAMANGIPCLRRDSPMQAEGYEGFPFLSCTSLGGGCKGP